MTTVMTKKHMAVGLLALVLLGLGLFAIGRSSLLASQDSPVAIGGPFHLINQDGAAVDQNLLRGGWTAVYFGYSFCPDACPATLTSLAAAQAKLLSQHKTLRVVFISVDPARDTPVQLKTYLSSPSFPKATMGLTGSLDQVAAAAKAYHIFFKRNGAGAGYSVDHSSVIYLIDPRGQFNRPIGYDVSPTEMADQIGQAMATG